LKGQLNQNLNQNLNLKGQLNQNLNQNLNLNLKGQLNQNLNQNLSPLVHMHYYSYPHRYLLKKFHLIKPL
jgi:hypothetical protein